MAGGPGTFVLPPGVLHRFANRGYEVVRMLNVHAPANFDFAWRAGSRVVSGLAS